MTTVSRTHIPRGFTLAETLVSMGVMAIVLTAVGALISLGARALPSKNDPFETAASVDRAIQTMSAELAQATALISLEPDAIEFEMPDHTGDSVNEIVRYEWSGVAGSPLIRQYNSNESVLLESADSLTFGHVSESASVQTGTEPELGAQQVLASYTDTGSISVTPIRSSANPIQIVKPVVPANASGFRVSAVRLYLRRDGLPESFLRVQLWRVNSAGTLTAQMGEVSRPELDAGASLGWMTFTFSGTTEYAPGTTLAIVMPNALVTSAGQVGYRSTQVPDWGGEVRIVNPFTSTTTVNPEGSLAFELLGRVARDVPVMVNSTRVKAVCIALTSGAAARKGVCRIVARPVQPLILTADAETSDSDGVVDELFGALEDLGMTRIGSAITDAIEEESP